MLEAIKMHKVMERSMEMMEVPGILHVDKLKAGVVPLRTLLLSQASASDGKLMFINIKRTREGSACSVGFPKQYGEEARDFLKDLGFRICEAHGVAMMDLFTLNEGKRIRDTKRVGGEIMSPEAMEINSLT